MESKVDAGKLTEASLWVPLVAVTMVVLVFIGDYITPAHVVVGSAYQAPVVLAGFKGSRQLTIQVLMLGIIGLALGWFLDFAADSYHFDAIRIENRLFSVVSLLIVGSLTLIVQRNALRVNSGR